MKKIELRLGCDISYAISMLHHEAMLQGEETCCEFNGYTLTSNMTEDEAYLLIIGRTKAEQVEAQRKWKEDWDHHKAEHEAAIPKLTQEYIARGHEILDESYWASWDDVVPARLHDLYEGMELNCTLELVRMLDIDKCDVKDAVKTFEEQNHSGMSASLMFAMMKEFSSRGAEFEAAARARF